VKSSEEKSEQGEVSAHITPPARTKNRNENTPESEIPYRKNIHNRNREATTAVELPKLGIGRRKKNLGVGQVSAHLGYRENLGARIENRSNKTKIKEFR